MREPVRFAVVGEGRDEHGASSQGPLLSPLPKNALRGGLVTLVERLLLERFGRAAVPVGWLAPVRNRWSQPPKAVELLADENLLARLLNELLRPAKRSPPSWPAAELVVLSVDGDRVQAFKRALSRVSRELQDRIIPLVFEPEFEVLFTCGKEPLEDACGLPRCSSVHPERQGDLKRCLERWLQRYGGGRPLDARLRQEIAMHLDVGLESPLKEVPAFRKLIASLARWA
ncbi:MAG: hypothetical protein JF614_09900 [Acidobacteria bacterium]|nr:hypothetical protein [Acidobacteriota bacterium]